MPLSRVQTTPLATALDTSVACAFAAPPTVGNGIVVPVNSWNSSSLRPASCTDNRGNVYTLAVQAGQSQMGAGVFYCPKIVATGAPFTITVTIGGTTFFATAGIEVSGVGAGLAIDRTVVNNTGNNAAPSTGPTAALTADEVFLVALHAGLSGQASITVESVTPPWTEAFEYLSDPRGEADSRVRSGVVGTTQSCSWTLATAGIWAAALVAFKAGAAAAGGGGGVPMGLVSVEEDPVKYNVYRPITPSDTVDLATPTDAIYVGGAGNLAAVMENGQAVTIAVPAGAFVPIVAKRINATNTTATGLVALNGR